MSVESKVVAFFFFKLRHNYTPVANLLREVKAT